MFNRLMELNPHSVSSLTNRLLEAHDRGYWNPDEELIESLRDALQRISDQVDDVASASTR
jgi:magnesium chelatase subunit H